MRRDDRRVEVECVSREMLNGWSIQTDMAVINKTRFGICGRQFIPETLILAIEELTAGHECCEDSFAVKWFEA